MSWHNLFKVIITLKQTIMKRFLARSIKYSDLELITQLYVGPNTAIHVFDPNGKVDWDLEEENSTTQFEKNILFNFGGELIRYKEFELNDFDCIIDFSKKVNVASFKTECLNFIQSPAGVIRYIYETKNRSFKFLDFLQTPTLRSKLIKFGLKTLLQLRLSWLCSQKFHILLKETAHLQTIAKDFDYSNYAIFMGTPGFWRKPVIQLQKYGEVTHYIKFPVSKHTAVLVGKEQTNINRAKAYRLNLIQLPTLEKASEKGILAQRTFTSQKLKRISHINEQLFLCQKELAIKSMKYEKIEGTAFYTEVLDQLNFLNNQTTSEHSKILHYLNQLKNTFERNKYTSTSLAHGDFTPWNIYQKENKFYVYDWEMSIAGAPLLYDIFHFIYQSELLVNRSGLKGVQHELVDFFKQPYMIDFVERFSINVDAHHQLYLLHVISKNLMLISQQPSSSADQSILLNAWKKALLELQLAPTAEDLRTTFLRDLELFLKDKAYAALKFNLPNFQSLPISADLDLAIQDDTLIIAEQFISEHVLVKRHVKVKKSFMSTSQIHFGHGAFLSIDFIYDFIRKGVRYLDIKAVLLNAQLDNGVRRPTLFHDIEYAQHFYTLNNASVPLKYQQIFSRKLAENEQKNIYLNTLERKYKIRFENLSDAFSYSAHKKKKIRNYIHKKHTHRGFVSLQKRLVYLLDMLVDLKQNKGFIVTFSGVDGAGKTTIINAVKKQLEEKYRKEIVLLRHRPGLLPILSAIKHGSAQKAEQKASETLPRQGQNKSTLSSYLRFAYYLTDYLIGQVYVYFKYVLRGKVVIYDRYYFDFINDAKRSNIRLKREFIKRFFRFIYKPDFNFYLYNEPEVILKRKQELTEKDIISLNSKYASLFLELENNRKGTYHQIKNDIQSETIAEIFSTINEVA